MARAPAKKRPVKQDNKAARAPRARRTTAIWRGLLKLALVSVPVEMFSAVDAGARLSFHQIHEPSGKRIQYQKIAPGIGPVKTEDIVKGYELEDGNYVILEDEELDAVKLEAKRTLDLVQFVDRCEIDPIYFDRPYYVTPDGEEAEEAYRVMRDALRGAKKIGLGQLVMRGREYIVALSPCGDGMLAETLRFADEIRAAAPLFADIHDAKSDKELLDLATELIGRKTAAFDASRFHDKYTDAVRELIDAKIAHRKITAVEEPDPRRGKVVDLMEALRRSVSNDAAPAGGRRKKAS